MKLSEILPYFCDCSDHCTSCDREIDREALAKIIKDGITRSDITVADLVISTMPMWLKRVK